MRVSLLIFSVFLFTITSAHGQSGYFEDAFRFSQVNPSGSARIMGIGGTQWSLGGDVSNVAGNAAGLGFFRKSEVSFTLGFSNWGVQTTHLGGTRDYNTSNLNLPNISLVFAKPKNEYAPEKFKGGAFGIGIQRLANFNTEFGFFSDKVANSSILDFYLQNSFGVTENQIEGYGLTGLAYQTYLINPVTVDENGGNIPNPSTYDSFILGQPFQDENVSQQGSANQITFSYGGNYDHKVFFGASLGIRSFEYSSRKIFNEQFTDEPLANSSLRENLSINGGGVNLNLGLIYKPIDNVNLGFNFQSPTYYAISEEYDAGINAIYNNYFFEQEDITLGQREALTDVILSSYNLLTPLKIGGGASLFLGKNGFLSADIDWIDYSLANINSRDFNQGPDNDAIKSLYTSTINYRLGGEYKINQFRFRGGYAFFGDPFADSANFNRSSQQLSGGIGAKFNKITIDFALVNRKINGLYSSYQVLDNSNNNYGPVTEVKNNILNGFLTVGINF